MVSIDTKHKNIDIYIYIYWKIQNLLIIYYIYRTSRGTQGLSDPGSDCPFAVQCMRIALQQSNVASANQRFVIWIGYTLVNIQKTMENHHV